MTLIFSLVIVVMTLRFLSAKYKFGNYSQLPIFIMKFQFPLKIFFYHPSKKQKMEQRKNY